MFRMFDRTFQNVDADSTFITATDLLCLYLTFNIIEVALLSAEHDQT